MLDFRIKSPKSSLNWRYQEVIVTENYYEQHKDDINLIELDYDYTMGLHVLDVYLNGQRLRDAGGYIEVDALHIRLNIGEDENGEPLPLVIGDEIIIKEWFNAEAMAGDIEGLTSIVNRIQVEINNARGEYPSLGDRFDSIDRDIANLLGEGNYQIDLEYAPNMEDVVSEIVSGDYSIKREFTFYPDGKPHTEVITHGDSISTRTYSYNEIGRLVRVVSTLEKS